MLPTSPSPSPLPTWPVGNLSETDFERFCAALMGYLYPKAQVNRYGSSGDKQHGIDIEVTLEDGVQYDIQCKRYKNFSPANVRGVVTAYTRTAGTRILLLSCVATPKVRDEIRIAPPWQVWDSEDITRKIHTLPVIQQEQLLRIFFPGQYMSLLGRPGPSPWQSPDAFFNGFLDSRRPFSHHWDLVGRDAAVEALLTAIAAPSPRCVQIIAPGGNGKTRLLRTIADSLAVQRKPVWFLSAHPLTPASLADLGSGPKVLICDDAHNRTAEDLLALADYAARPCNQTCLILALRPYGKHLISQQTRSFPREDIYTCELDMLTELQMITLAEAALGTYGVSTEYAPALAKATRHCPLLTVLGAKTLSASGTHPEFLISQEGFVQDISARLLDMYLEHLNQRTANARPILDLVSALQPIKQNHCATLAEITGLQEYQISETLDLLEKDGYLYRNGNRLSLAPDTIADLLIESCCLTRRGEPSGFADKVFGILSPAPYGSSQSRLLSNFLLNLCRMDWRRQQGEVEYSTLPDHIWNRLDPIHHGKAVKRIAHYMPERAFNFARRMSVQDSNTRDLAAKIIENVVPADPRYLQVSCSYLWQTGYRLDKRNGSLPKPIQVLADFAEPVFIDRWKSTTYLEQVAAFSIQKMGDDACWQHDVTPLDILKNLLKTEGVSGYWTESGAHFLPFFIPVDFIKQIRRQALQACLSLLNHADWKRAYLAAQAIADAVHHPLYDSATEEAHAAWSHEFAWLFEEILKIIRAAPLSPLVLSTLAFAAARHARRTKDPAALPAKKILAHTEKSLEAILMLAFRGKYLDTYFQDLEYPDLKKQRRKQVQIFQNLAKRCLREVPDLPSSLLRTVSILTNLRALSLRQYGETSRQNDHIDFTFLHTLLQADTSLIFSLFAAYPRSTHEDLAAQTLRFSLRHMHACGQKIAERLFKRRTKKNLTVLAAAYGDTSLPAITDLDRSILRHLSTCNDKSILWNTAHAAFRNKNSHPDFATELLLGANLQSAGEALHLYLMWLPKPDEMSAEQAESVLQKLSQSDDLSHHQNSWNVAEFLTQCLHAHPSATLGFLKQRLEYQLTAGLEKHHLSLPELHAIKRNTPSPFTAHPDAEHMLSALFDQAHRTLERREQEWVFSKFLAALFPLEHPRFIRFLKHRIAKGDQDDLKLAVYALCKAGELFAVKRPAFFCMLLDLATDADRKTGTSDNTLARRVESFGFASGLAITRSGSTGEPDPTDAYLDRKSSIILKRLPRGSVTYNFYMEVKRQAQRNIERRRSHFDDFYED